jgi:hypothetical protein
MLRKFLSVSPSSLLLGSQHQQVTTNTTTTTAISGLIFASLSPATILGVPPKLPRHLNNRRFGGNKKNVNNNKLLHPGNATSVSSEANNNNLQQVDELGFSDVPPVDDESVRQDSGPIRGMRGGRGRGRGGGGRGFGRGGGGGFRGGRGGGGRGGASRGSADGVSAQDFVDAANSMMKPGGGNNNPTNNNSFRGGRGGGGRGAGAGNVGNTACPKCNASNFPGRTTCFKCKTSLSASPGNSEGPSVMYHQSHGNFAPQKQQQQQQQVVNAVPWSCICGQLNPANSPQCAACMIDRI